MYTGNSPTGSTTVTPPALRMEPLDIAVVVIYFIIVLGVGIWVGVETGSF